MENTTEIIERFVRIRDRIAEMEARSKAEIAPYKDALAKLNAKLLTVMNTVGADSLKTAHGTAFKARKISVSVDDKEAFVNWLRETDHWSLLTLQANKIAVEEFREAHNDVPPGIGRREEIVVSVRRS